MYVLSKEKTYKSNRIERLDIFLQLYLNLTWVQSISFILRGLPILKIKKYEAQGIESTAEFNT